MGHRAAYIHGLPSHGARDICHSEAAPELAGLTQSVHVGLPLCLHYYLLCIELLLCIGLLCCSILV